MRFPAGLPVFLRTVKNSGLRPFAKPAEWFRKNIKPKHWIIAFSAALWLIPASTPHGAVPFLPACAADPRPTAGWGALWFPDDSNFAVAAGRELLARPDFPAAVCYLRLAEDARDQDPQFLTDLGEAYWGAGEPDLALAEWEKALALFPDGDDLSVQVWKGYFEIERWDRAETAIGRRLESRPDDPEAKYALALIRAAQNPGGALALLAELKSAPQPIGANARSLEAVIRAAIARRVPEYIFASTGEELIRLGEMGLAKEALRRAIERNPKYGEAYALLGVAQEASGEDPEESYRRGAALAPDSALACLVYGAWLRRRGEIALARWWLMQAWRERPGDWIIAAELAQADFALGNPGDAESWVRQSVDLFPGEPEAWIVLAAFYIENDFRVAEAGIPAARQAVILAPNNDRALDLLGLGWFKMGDSSLAERLFLRALEENPDSAKAHLHLGMVYREQGRAADARTEWETALRLDPKGLIGSQAKDLMEKP
ncbi:MAG: tetratricopeptide repeat protein [Anaerolineales bacterium]|nr:tetratricopeptide repeat protein [Anaerolineales bacterium]